MNKTILGSAMLGTIAIVAITVMVMMANTPMTREMPEKIREWQAVGDADPGAGASGVLVVYVYPHQAVPTTAYASNISTVTAYEYNDGLNASLGTDVPYDTAFDIVVKVRANTTHAYNSTGSCWEVSWIRANITCADLSIGADTAMSEQEITNTSTYIWVHYYMNNAGAGYQISHGESVNVTSFTFDAYY